MKYERNHAFSWQRITSWILLVTLIGHVVKFRFMEYPTSATEGTKTTYFVRVSLDNGLYTVAQRLGVTLYDKAAIERERMALTARSAETSLVEAATGLRKEVSGGEIDRQTAVILDQAQSYEERVQWMKALEKRPIKSGQVIAAASDFGTASLLEVRDTFKSPIWVAIYTLFVLAACYHGFNGFWTFLITWGVILKMGAQKSWVKVAYGVMILVAFLGLASIWGTYWLNLRY